LARCAESRASGQGFEARLEGVATREAAEQHVGLRIEVPRAALPPAAEGEHYRVDLIGCTVRNLEGVELGVLERFEDFPANPVMVVRGDRERWLPVTPQHLRQIDAVARCVTVDWPAEF
jgi:16S rRNA processing protein RimM